MAGKSASNEGSELLKFQVDVHVDSTVKTTAEAGEPVKIAPFPEKNPLWKKMQLMACLVSGIASRLKEFRKKQDESCCSHGENEYQEPVWHLSQKVDTILQ